jgi:hypothetical protein
MDTDHRALVWLGSMAEADVGTLAYHSHDIPADSKLSVFRAN